MKRKGILCFLKNENKVLLLKVDFGNGKLFWSGVSGYIETNEKEEDAVVREVKEEIGVVVEKSSLKYQGNHTVSDKLDLDVFIATDWSGKTESKEESIKEVQWFDLDMLPFHEMFPDNKDWLPDMLGLPR